MTNPSQFLTIHYERERPFQVVIFIYWCLWWLFWKLQRYRHRKLCQHLSHLPLVPHIWVSESSQYWFSQCLVAYFAPSHYLNQCWFHVNWSPGNKCQWNSKRNFIIFIQENVTKFVACQDFVQGEMSKTNTYWTVSQSSKTGWLHCIDCL